MISNEMDRTLITMDVANFVEVGAGSLSSAVDTLTLVLSGGKGGGGGRVLLANEGSQTSGDSEKEPPKEKPRDQGMNGKWNAVHRDLIQPNGICRRQLKMIINRNMAPEDAMVACHALRSEKSDEKCNFCESKGAIGKDIIDQARKILGKDEPGSSSAKDE